MSFFREDQGLEDNQITVGNDIWEVTAVEDKGYSCEGEKCDIPGQPQAEWTPAVLEVELVTYPEDVVTRCYCSRCFEEWSGMKAEEFL